MKNRDEWSEIFLNTDSCCTPVLEPEEVHEFEYFKNRKSFKDQFTPNISPRFLLNNENENQNENNTNLIEILNKLKINNDELNSLIKDGILKINKSKL